MAFLCEGDVCYGAVKYFNNEQLERRNFAKAIDDYQQIEYKCDPVPGHGLAIALARAAPWPTMRMELAALSPEALWTMVAVCMVQSLCACAHC